MLVARDGFDMTNLKGRVQAVYMGMRKSDDDRTDVRFYDSLEESLNAVERESAIIHTATVTLPLII